MECREVDRFAELSFDGEIDTIDRALLERHLTHCPACRRRVEARDWVQSEVRAHLKARSEAEGCPLGLATRLGARLRAEERRQGSRLRRLVPLSLGVAAIATLSWSTRATGTAVLDPEASVAHHAAQLPPEVRTLGGMVEVRKFLERNFHPDVALPVSERQLPDLRLVGARLDHVADRRAASLMFESRGARVSMLVYPRDREVVPPPRFEARRVGGRPVWVGRHRGYNVVAWTRGALVYSVVSDIDSCELERIAQAF